MMSMGVPRECAPGESRVALVPASLPPWIKAGIEVRVESGAGLAASYSDEAYQQAGAKVLSDAREVLSPTWCARCVSRENARRRPR